MQDRYAGDVGDFLKLGLLRQLTAATAGGQGLSLGIVWYRTPDESHNDDGKHVGYLQPGNPVGARLRPLDPFLFDRLASVVSSGSRSVGSLVSEGVLPPGAVSYDAVLEFESSRQPRTERENHRSAWLEAALRAVDGCGLVFADPDNGIRSADHSVGRHRSKSTKHAYLDELGAFLDRGQSLVVYHHADRSASVDQQIIRRFDEITRDLGTEPLAAVRASRGTTRLFLIIPSDSHREALKSALCRIDSSPWSTELKVVWWT
jgi:hypothetical protein